MHEEDACKIHNKYSKSATVRVGEDLPLRYLHAAKVIFISVFLASCRWIKDLVLVIKFGSPPVGSLIP